MASQALQPLGQTLDAVQIFFTSNAHGQQLPLRIAATGSVAYFLYSAWANYQQWLALGPGGLPYNLWGWLSQWARRLTANADMTSTSMYDDPAVISKYGEIASRSFLDLQLPQRAPRPHVYHFVVPQRQEQPGSSPALRKLQEEEFNKIVRENSHMLNIKTSLLEKRGAAIFIADGLSVPPYCEAIRREVGHLHLDAEGSSHWTVSAADAKHIVGQGWGQRHMLSGCVPFLPHSYVLLYAPMSEEEVKAQSAIIKASIAFLTGGLKVA